MTWYYAESGRSAGPLTEAQLVALIAQGGLPPHTLVWREGMAQWQPYNQIRPPVVPASAPAVPAATAVAPHEALCSECGRTCDRQDLLAYGRLLVCAQCKPLFLQKLAEGAVTPLEVRYAGFWIRAGAKFIDGLILRVIGLPISLLFMLTSSGDTVTALLMLLLGFTVSLGLALGYTVFFLGRFGATPGKMACRLKVVTADSKPISYAKAFARFWAEFLSAATLLVGYIMAGFDEQKRALHDRLCQTRVVFK